jgi:hypothetical protein
MGAVTVAWTLGTLFVGPILLPIYLSKRPLKTCEVREGGTAWNVLKNFAILWTIVMAVAAFSALSTMGHLATSYQSDAERAGAGIGMFLGLGLLGVAWFVPTLGSALLGFLLKKNSVVEQGPTGPLFGADSRAGLLNGPAGLALAAFVSLIVVGALTLRESPVSPRSSAARTGMGAGSLPKSGDAEENGWRLSEKTSEMDGTREVILPLDAESEIPGIILPHRPYLAIQCHGGKPDLAVEVGTPIQPESGQYESYGVRVKLDNGAPSSQRWIESTSGVALFSPAPARLIRQLATADVFLFEFTPFERTATTVRFRVSGLLPNLVKVAPVCGIRLSAN